MSRKTIWKFPINVVGHGFIAMPKGAEILTVQTQDDAPFIWAVVNPDAEKEDRYFEVYGTGHPIYQDMGVNRKYIGTFQQPPLVWHLFERL